MKFTCKPYGYGRKLILSALLLSQGMFLSNQAFGLAEVLQSGQSPIVLSVKDERTVIMDITDPQYKGYDVPVEFRKYFKREHSAEQDNEKSVEHKEFMAQVINLKAENAPLVILDGKEYKLLQFHFHAPSEHKIDNKQSVLEVHFVHKNDDGGLAVVGLLFNLGAKNDAIEKVIELGRKKELDALALTPMALLNSSRDMRVFRYHGSLTTPPYTENVKWQVLRGTSEVSQEQLDEMTKLGLLNPARKEQDLKGRSVVADSHLSK